MRTLRIAMDLNGNVADPLLVKQKVAYLITGNLIDPQKLKREIAVPEGLLTTEQYDRMNHAIYEDLNLFLQAPPVPGAIRAIKTLVREGHEIDIVTAIGELAYKNAMIWCDQHGIGSLIRLIGVGPDGSKAEVMKQISIHLDDEVKQLMKVRREYLALQKRPPLSFLLSRPYNTHERTDIHLGTETVRGHHDFVKRVRRIAMQQEVSLT